MANHRQFSRSFKKDMAMNETKAAAQAWRQDKGYIGRGGVVVVFQNQVAGWVNELRNPDHWAEGCFAVAEDGCSWTALGGTEFGGALMWLPNDLIPDGEVE